MYIYLLTFIYLLKWDCLNGNLPGTGGNIHWVFFSTESLSRRREVLGDCQDCCSGFIVEVAGKYYMRNLRVRFQNMKL